jgi:hypothetical protein
MTGLRFSVPLLPAGCNADIRKSQQLLDPGPFTHVVAFNQVAQELQKISQAKAPQSPVPLAKTEQYDPCHRQGNSDQVDVEIERHAMSLAPVMQRFAQEVYYGSPPGRRDYIV